jgi:hypothetical protein
MDTIDRDDFEQERRYRVHRINAEPHERAALETRHGKVWNTQELAEEFDVLGFMAPFVVVARKADGKKGSLEFQHSPRFYFNFAEDR